MKMYYYDLNAQYLSKGDSSSKNVVTKSVSFFANRIVHTKNRRGTGDVFAERDPEKGFVNYWVKIIVGGVLTNTGVRTDKKQWRKYRKALNNHVFLPFLISLLITSIYYLCGGLFIKVRHFCQGSICFLQKNTDNHSNIFLFN